MIPFSELHAHDEYSNVRLIDSTVKLTTLIDTAFEIGLKGVAITDHECLSGHIKAIKHYKQNEEKYKDFKIVLGNEIYLINEDDYQNTNKFFHFILLAKDKKGHKQLRELSTRAWKRLYTHKGVERVPTFYSDLVDVISKDKGHIIGATACLGGYLPLLLLNGDIEKAGAFTSWCQDIFGADNFYVEMQPGISEEQIQFNKIALDFCKSNNLEWIFTNDVHYTTKEKSKLHAAYLNSKDEERETASFYENTYFKSSDQIIERLEYMNNDDIKHGLENTVRITNEVEIYDLYQDVIVPERAIPDYSMSHLLEPYYYQYEYINKFAHSEYDQDRFLLYQIEKGLQEKDEALNPENLERIDIELKQLWEISIKLKQRMPAYYNLVKFLIEIMWDDNKGNSLVGPARGSVTGFYICYLIGITQVNPLKWNLPYWRHLVADRPELPDVDVDSQASQRPVIFQAFKKEFGEDRCLNIITFKHETSKAAILTSCRGLGIDIDTAREIASLVPITRGEVWSIKECLEGNEDNNYTPNREFINKVKEYEMLLDTILEIENLVCGRSSHASGFYLFNNHYLEQNSLMKAPKGINVTCWDMDDSDYCGALKVDILTIRALDKERKAMDLLIADGELEWKGSLKATYDSYLHPDVIDYTAPEMWDLLGENKIVDVFQFDTMVGSESVKKIKPTSLKQMAIANSVMRLVGSNDLVPIDRFVEFKNDLMKWYKEMREACLDDSEVAILEKYLKHNYGSSVEQEDVMELAMDKGIAGFSIIEANKLRKGIAKKKKEVILEVKQLFYEKGKKQGTRKEMLNYVWNYCFRPQLGYSFSRNHTLPYSAIGLQEMNLAYFYPRIYWNTACLTINASADEEVEANKSTDYGKIAKAISDMQSHGIVIALPDINTAKYEFFPDRENDQIIFGLKGINAVGDDVVENIIQHRPYHSLQEFLEKNQFDTKVMINLIKAGCFDRIEEGSRSEIMRDYIVYLTKQKVEAKKQLNFRNLNSIIELNILPPEFEFQKRLHAYRKYVFTNEFLVEKGKYILDDLAKIFFDSHCISNLQEGKDFWNSPDGIIVKKSSFEKWYNEKMDCIKQWLDKPETVEQYNKGAYNAFANSVWEKYCAGNQSKWEMDSLSFYYGEHELAHVNREKYKISSFQDIPSKPIIIGKFERKSKTTGETKSWDKYQLFNIMGTVLDRNSNNHYITLLTPDGVVTVKLYGGSFAHYDKQVSKKFEGDTKKTVLEKSWFSRGNKLLITGIRREDTFYPKRYYDSIYQHTICLIEDVDRQGNLTLKYERERS